MSDLDKKFAEAYARPGEKIPVGRDVVCDICDADWTDRPESGGILFESKAVCPDCTPRFMASVIKYREQRFIRGECPKGQSYADWVRELRGPDAFIRVTLS